MSSYNYNYSCVSTFILQVAKGAMASLFTPIEQAIKKMEDQLNCAICLDPYKDPKLLNCFHVFCTQCLQPLVQQSDQGQTVLCPNCRQLTTLPQNGVPGLQGAFRIHHLFDIHDTLKKVVESPDSPCDKCKRGKTVKYCRTCGQFICNACVTAHETWTELSSHEVITIQQLTSDAQKLVPPKKQVLACPKHPEKELDLFCDTCEELICRDCIVRVHREHQYDLVDDAFPKHKKVIVDSVLPVEQQLTSINTALESLNVCCSKITKQRQAVATDIERSIQQLHAALEKRKQELFDQLDQITNQKLKKLAAQREQLEEVGTQLKSCRDFVQESLSTGNKEEILDIKKPVIKQITEMTAKLKPESLEVYEQADVKYASNQTELIHLCQQMGRVYSHSVCPEKCHVSTSGVGIATVGDTSTATLLVLDHGGQEFLNPLEDVSSELVSSDGGIRIAIPVNKQERNKYEMRYRPQRRGQHHLHVQVEGKHISGSPLSVIAIPKELTVVRDIKGVQSPWQVAFNHRGDMFVAENNNQCVSIFSVDGKKNKSFGTQESGLEKFNRPTGVTTDDAGDILVCDSGNCRIQKFSADGSCTQSVGKHGSGPLQFNDPRGIAIHPHTKKIYVADTYNHRIQILNEDLSFSSSFGKRGSGKGEFNNSNAVAFDSNGQLYVAEFQNSRIQVFSENNEYLREFGKEELKSPISVTVHGGVVYVADYDGKSILLYTREGQYLRSFKPFDGRPHGIEVRSNGEIFVCYGHNCCIIEC